MKEQQAIKIQRELKTLLLANQARAKRRMSGATQQGLSSMAWSPPRACRCDPGARFHTPFSVQQGVRVGPTSTTLGNDPVPTLKRSRSRFSPKPGRGVAVSVRETLSRASKLPSGFTVPIKFGSPLPLVHEAQEHA